MTAYSPLETNIHLEGICHFHLQGRRMSRVCCLLYTGFSLGEVTAICCPCAQLIKHYAMKTYVGVDG
jgi:hypothetical protein